MSGEVGANDTPHTAVLPQHEYTLWRTGLIKDKRRHKYSTLNSKVMCVLATLLLATHRCSRYSRCYSH